MGMFDSVIARCHECGHPVEFQSKAGDCQLRRYSTASVPEQIALDLDGAVEPCPKCRELVSIAAPSNDVVRVAMTVSGAGDGFD